ncbi:P-loop NTPase [Halopiger aswanensis]|uniref:ATP-binding protein involved in chromosome partitioning n=1 Tax=Halopiger aswanensis TaxID=148449 RepID=A0A419WP91_9EURY|nr:P-loop NTPase [Halopiger aswanensis]RKD97206.1 ATP-binding protein involved in chromosome partitioning [Halopiger aswanensis]
MPDETPQTDDEIRRAVIDRVREVQIMGGDPVSEQLIEDVDVEDGIVTFTVDFEPVSRVLADRLTDQLRGAGLATDGVIHVRVEAAGSDAPETGLPVSGVDSLIAVGSAKGGVGKTTVTVSLARALNEAGLDVGVFDANVYAPDAPDLLEAEGPVQSSPSGKPMPVEVDGIQVVSIELIAEDGPVAWRGAMVHDVVKDLLGDAAWDDRDVLLVDLPPGIGDAVYTIVQQAPLDGGLLVSTPTEEGVRATQRTAALYTANDVPTVGVVPNMVGSVADAAGPFDDADPETIAEDVVEAAYADVAPVPFDPALREPTAASFADPETEGERAIADLRATVESFLEHEAGPAVPEDAVDLRGLPPETCHRQVVTELGVTEGPVSVVMRGEPDDLVSVVDESLERDGRSLERTDVEDLGYEGWLVELEPSASSTAVSEPAT